MRLLQTAIQRGAPHLWESFEVAHHIAWPAVRSGRRAYQTRSTDETWQSTAKRAVKTALIPVTLGATLLGLLTLAERHVPPELTETKWARGWINGHDLMHVAGGAILGLASGVIEALKPQWSGHPHADGAHSHDHPGEGSAKPSNTDRAHRAIKAGLSHAWKDLLIDAAWVAVGKGLIAATGGDPRSAHPHGSRNHR